MWQDVSAKESRYTIFVYFEDGFEPIYIGIFTAEYKLSEGN